MDTRLIPEVIPAVGSVGGREGAGEDSARGRASLVQGVGNPVETRAETYRDVRGGF